MNSPQIKFNLIEPLEYPKIMGLTGQRTGLGCLRDISANLFAINYFGFYGITQWITMPRFDGEEQIPVILAPKVEPC